MTVLRQVLIVLAAPFCFVTGKDDMSFATKGVHQLEQAYVDDCTTVDTTPHGYYGAFLQPCEFQFRQTILHDEEGDPCSDEASTLVSTPVPMNWFFNTTNFFNIDPDVSWDETVMSQDDLPSPEQELLLWPDQCVGVTPRCYAVEDEAIHETLVRIFSSKNNSNSNNSSWIPESATHVRVDCRGDAVALTRVVYALAEGLEKSTAMLVTWLVTVVLLFVLLILCCLCGCLRLCCFRGHSPQPFRRSSYEAIDAEQGIMLTKLI